MKLVSDTSVIIAVITNEPTKAALVAQTQGSELVAPSTLDFEIGNSFSAMLRRKRVSLEQALTAIEIYRQIPINLIEIDVVEAVKLAAQLNIYAYDAYMIACAQDQNCPLITLDAGLMRAAKIVGVEVLEAE